MKKWMALPLVSLLILAAGQIPTWMLDGAQRYRVITPQSALHQDSVRSTGALYPRYACQVMAGGMYEVLEVYVSLGEQVERGQAVSRVREVQAQSFYTYEAKGSELAPQSKELEALARMYGGGVEEMAEMMGEGGWKAAQQLLEDQVTQQPAELLVTAPISGVINTKLPLAGTVVHPGETLYGVNSHRSWLVLANVSEKQAMNVQLGNTVKVTGDALEAEAWGRVTSISPRAKQVFNGTGYDTVVEVEVAMDDLEGQYTTGISVKAQIFTEDAREVLLLPYEAVYQNDRNAEFVLVAGPGGLAQRTVKTGVELADGVEIAQGLGWGERVVVVPGYQETLPQVYLLEEGG